MDKEIDELLTQYVRDRDDATFKAIETDSVEPYKALIEKYRPLGFIPPCFKMIEDATLEITIRKVAYHSINLPQETRDKAKRWLLDRGYDLELE